MHTLCPLCHSATVMPSSEGAGESCAEHYAALIRRERSDLRYMRSHALTVDTWAAQHPESDEADSHQALGVHLVSLYAQLVLGMSHREVKGIRQRATETIDFRRLPLPGEPATVSAAHPLAADHPDAHRRLVQQWARSVWQAWDPHHAQIMSWARRVIGHGRVAVPPEQVHSGWYAGARNIVHPTADTPVSSE